MLNTLSNFDPIQCYFAVHKHLFQIYVFTIVNRFKPLLDVYQTPFKIKFYYWVGLHLLTNALFYALSALDKTTNLTIGIIVLYAIASGTGYMHPFKCWIQNCNEMILLFNLSTMYVVSLSGTSFMAIYVMFMLVVSQFILIIIDHNYDCLCNERYF